MTKSQRLFVALAVPKEVSQEIALWQQAHAPEGAKPIPQANFHLTLAFLGQQQSPAQHKIEQALSEIRSSGWQQRLDQFRQFKKPQIGYLSPRTPQPELLNLASLVQTKMKQLDVALPEHEFRPHVTLYRNFRLNHWHNAPVPGWHWPVTHFSLYLSEHGHYQELHRWPLTP